MSYYNKDRDNATLGKFYTDHVSAMTREGLHKKSDIASELAVRDARIAEMERDNERFDAQWRDELRIYRETENARIAELEQAVTVRDTEIARLETDLELARRDAERYRWLRDESGNDHHTPWCAVGYSDPTWLTGEHLDAAIDEARAGNGGGV